MHDRAIERLLYSMSKFVPRSSSAYGFDFRQRKNYLCAQDIYDYNLPDLHPHNNVRASVHRFLTTTAFCTSVLPSPFLHVSLVN